MAKPSAIREMSDEQLQHELREAQQSLFRLRVKAATERNDVPSNVKKLRRDIARMFTVQRERELSKI
jgi:large subunit ribosomal protein L29